MERVRQTTARVVDEAQLVRLNREKLNEVAARHDPAQIRAAYNFETPYHLSGVDDELLVNYIFTVDALNFGSGLSPQWKKLEAAQLVQNSLYKTVADTLRRLAESGSWLDARWAAKVTPTEVAGHFKIPADFPLVVMFANCLNELGAKVNAAYGTYPELVKANPTAADLVEWVGGLEFFNDRANYNGYEVFFYKRAQILVNDLYLAFKGTSYGAFPDVTNLTLFADNLLPHYFRMEGVLIYDPALLGTILNEEVIPAGSPAEVEMRAAAVQCVETLCQIYNERFTPGETPIFPAQLDNFLWNFSQSPQVKSQPRHRTVTYFY
jgi:hypothetical protein